MEDKHRDILKNHWSELRRDLEPIKLLPHMVRVLDKADEQQVKVKATREEKVDELLDLLPRKGPDAFQVFVEALQKVQPFLANLLVQESAMEEMKVELKQTRTKSAQLHKKVQELETDCDSERESHKNTVKEVGEIISQYQACLKKRKNEMHSVLLKHQELEDANKKVGEALVAEKCEIELNLIEATRLLENAQSMKYSYTEQTVQIQSNDTDRADSELEKPPNQCELVRVSNERDALKMKCGELKQQLEDTLASLERQRTVSFHDRATSPGEPVQHDFEGVFNYRSDFDTHGIIYALGTKFGTTAWVNPSSASSSLTRVIVTRSSGYRGKATDLLDRKGAVTGTEDEKDSWWCVDLSEKYALFLSHYTLRHGRDNGMSIIRNWRLKGSLDGRLWTLLKEHKNDRGLEQPSPYYTATWSIDGEVRAFRYFRIIQTGKNSSGRFGLFLSGIELYGILLKMTVKRL